MWSIGWKLLLFAPTNLARLPQFPHPVEAIHVHHMSCQRVPQSLCVAQAMLGGRVVMRKSHCMRRVLLARDKLTHSCIFIMLFSWRKKELNHLTMWPSLFPTTVAHCFQQKPEQCETLKRFAFVDSYSTSYFLCILLCLLINLPFPSKESARINVF